MTSRLRRPHRVVVTAVLLGGMGLLSPTAGASAAVPSSGPKPPVVQTRTGALQGVTTPTTINYLGVPYAAPPTGDLRWQPPQPAAGWKGVRDATQFGKHCPQQGPAEQPDASEDCLFLNVYAPAKRSTKRQPVMVWFHGGANAVGTSEGNEPTPLVETGNVVGVTVNYRLGALGFLAHPALDTEGHPAVNYGILDQQQALRWVRDNIDRFGGDPGNVTIFGVSAGGLDVTSHLVSPGSSGLFHRAIIESGAYQLNTPSLAQSEAQGTAFASRAGCADQRAACLRSLPLDEILRQQGAVNSGGSSYNQSTVDGIVLPERQIDAITAGRINRVPVMQGANAVEGHVFADPRIDEAGYVAQISGFAAAFGKDPAAALATYSLARYGTPYEASSAALGDAAIACSALTSNAVLNRMVPTYAYEFADSAAGPLGATHGGEVRYLLTSQDPSPLPPASRQLAATMQRYWATFARWGNPNGPSAPPWPRMVGGQNPAAAIMSLVAPTPSPDTVANYSARHNCDFWS